MEKSNNIHSLNVLSYSAREEAIFNNMAEDIGYERLTTFFSDLSIAEYYNPLNVKETYKKVISSWSNDVKYFTEFILCLNWKCWEWYEREGASSKLSLLYKTLYDEAYNIAIDKFKGADADYFYRVTD